MWCNKHQTSLNTAKFIVRNKHTHNTLKAKGSSVNNVCVLAEARLLCALQENI